MKNKEEKKRSDKEYIRSPEGRFVGYRSRSKRKKRIFEIDFEFAKNLFLSDCFYCGVKPDPMNGIDRINSSIGYIKDNCVACCELCNSMKLDYPINDFLNHINEIYNCQNK